MEKTYIGSSKNIEKRWKQYKRLECKRQKALYSSLAKYGYELHKFQIICVCPEDKLLWHEQYYIDNFQPELNIAKMVGRPPTKSGNENHMWKGGICSDMKAYRQSEEYKTKQKEYKQTEEYKAKQKEYQKAYKHTEEYKAKQKEYQKKYQQSEEYKTYKREYEQTEGRKAYQKERRQSEEYKAYQKAYREKKRIGP